MSQVNNLDQLLAENEVEYPEDRELASKFYALGWKAAMHAKEKDNAEEIANHAYEPDSLGI